MTSEEPDKLIHEYMLKTFPWQILHKFVGLFALTHGETEIAIRGRNRTPQEGSTLSYMCRWGRIWLDMSVESQTIYLRPGDNLSHLMEFGGPKPKEERTFAVYLGASEEQPKEQPKEQPTRLWDDIKHRHTIRAQHRCIAEVHIGGCYKNLEEVVTSDNGKSRELTGAFLRFDIDAPDFSFLGLDKDDIRSIDYALPLLLFSSWLVYSLLDVAMGCKNSMIAYSGKKGMHIWNMNTNSFEMDSGLLFGRGAPVDSFRFMGTCKDENDPLCRADDACCDMFKQHESLNPNSESLFDDCLLFWEQVAIAPRAQGGLGLFDVNADIEKFVKRTGINILMRSSIMANILNRHTPILAWRQIQKECLKIVRESLQMAWVKRNLDQAVLYYVLPRLDANVTKDSSHLTKAFGCVHSGTRRIAVPVAFNPDVIEFCKASTVPKITVDALMQHDPESEQVFKKAFTYASVVIEAAHKRREMELKCEIAAKKAAEKDAAKAAQQRKDELDRMVASIGKNMSDNAKSKVQTVDLKDCRGDADIEDFYEANGLHGLRNLYEELQEQEHQQGQEQQGAVPTMALAKPIKRIRNPDAPKKKPVDKRAAFMMSRTLSAYNLGDSRMQLLIRWDYSTDSDNIIGDRFLSEEQLSAVVKQVLNHDHTYSDSRMHLDKIRARMRLIAQKEEEEHGDILEESVVIVCPNAIKFKDEAKEWMKKRIPLITEPAIYDSIDLGTATQQDLDNALNKVLKNTEHRVVWYGTFGGRRPT